MLSEISNFIKKKDGHQITIYKKRSKKSLNNKIQGEENKRKRRVKIFFFKIDFIYFKLSGNVNIKKFF